MIYNAPVRRTLHKYQIKWEVLQIQHTVPIHQNSTHQHNGKSPDIVTHSATQHFNLNKMYNYAL
jgi:hypothetical protein